MTHTPLYMREYRARFGRSIVKERIAKHLAYWGERHPRYCRTCAHPCPGARCLTTLYDPYQVLCTFCRRTP